MKWCATLIGQPRSKSNRSQIARNKKTGAMFIVKNKKAQAYEKRVRQQAQAVMPSRLLEGPLRFTATLFYPSHRSDLDPSLLFDSLEGIVYKNDRQIKEMHIFHGIDKGEDRARAEVEVAELEPPEGTVDE